MKLRRIPMTFWLPMFSLLLWVLLVAVPVTLVYGNLLQSADGAASVTVRAGGSSGRVVREQFWAEALRVGTWAQSESVQSINLPAFIVQAPLSRLSGDWPSSWAPGELDFRTWRAISSSFFCLPFWWFAGLGIDGLMGRRRLRWQTLLAGTVLWGVFVVLLLGVRFGLSAEERGGMVVYLWGFGLWVGLLSVFPVGWGRRFRA